MSFPRRLFACLVFVLLAAPSCNALWSDVPPTDSLWRLASKAKIFLVRTGDARLDDGIEQGFATSWPVGSWSWIPDSGIADFVKDSTVLLFRLVEKRSPYRKTRERDCQKLIGFEQMVCLQEQAGGRFRMEIGGKRLGSRNGTMLLEAPSQARRMILGDAFVVDLPRDFAMVLKAVEDSAFPAGGAFSGTKYWARETLVRDRRARFATDTLWILAEQIGPVSVARLETILASPVRAVPSGEFESMLGTPRSGAYLEAGLLPVVGRQLRVREVSTGDLMLIDDGPAASGMVDTMLKESDFRRLAHRAAGDEFRPYLLVAAGPEISTYGFMGVLTGGYEFQRGWWGLLGWAKWAGSEFGVPGYSRDHIVLGIRYTPFLAWENPDLGSPRWLRSRLVFGARYWQPFGERDVDETNEWLDKVYPHLTLDIDLLGDLWYLGVSPEYWLGTNRVRKSWMGYEGDRPIRRSTSSDDFDGGWTFRLGFHYGIAGWRPGVGWQSAKVKPALEKLRPIR